MKQQIVQATQALLESNIVKHKMNIEVMLANPIAIHDHTDIMSAVELELGKMSEYKDKLETLKTYFGN